MAILFQPTQPVARCLITVRVLRGGCDGLLAGFNQVVVVEIRSSSPEPQFVEVVILLAYAESTSMDSARSSLMSFGKDVLQGDYFVFLNRSRNRCKILFWDRDGLVVWAKRLERGCFQVPRGIRSASLAIEVDCVTLAMMLGGVDLKNVKRRKRYQAVAG